MDKVISTLNTLLETTKDGEHGFRTCAEAVTNPRSRWQKIEAAKRRLIYTLINLSLPLPTAASGDGEPLIFDFLANPPDALGAPKVMTGHDNGIITVSLVEADDAIREQLRVSMGEPYRTLVASENLHPAPTT